MPRVSLEPLGEASVTERMTAGDSVRLVKRANTYPASNGGPDVFKTGLNRLQKTAGVGVGRACRRSTIHSETRGALTSRKKDRRQLIELIHGNM